MIKQIGMVLGATLVMLTSKVAGQSANLVPNPCFNEIRKCYEGDNLLPAHWFDRFSHIQHVDGKIHLDWKGIYAYHSRCPDNKNLPYRGDPRCGKGAGGLLAFATSLAREFAVWDTASHPLNNRYLMNWLKKPLQKGNRYYVRFYANLVANKGLSHLGMRFFADKDSTDMTWTTIQELKNGVPQVYTSRVIPPSQASFQKDSFYKVEGLFRASKAFKSFGIGVFFPMKKLDTIHVKNRPIFAEKIQGRDRYWVDHSAYMIDDVGVYEVPRVMSSRDTLICKRDSVPILLKGGQPYYISKRKSPGDTVSTDSITWVQPNKTTTYYINSVIKDSVRVRVADSVKLSLSTERGLCPDDTLKLNRNFLQGARYQWNTGATSPQILVAKPGVYNATMKAGSCEDRDTVEVYEKEDPPPMEISGNRALCEKVNEQAILAVQNGGYQRFFLDSSAFMGSKLRISDTGSFHLIGEFRNGCTREKEVTIQSSCSPAFYIPNAFSPNGDGINDQFCPVGLAVKNYQMRVYNRFGEKLFETTSLDQCWDGTYQGQKVPQGYYMYWVKYALKNSGQGSLTKTKKGVFRVVR